MWTVEQPSPSVFFLSIIFNYVYLCVYLHFSNRARANPYSFSSLHPVNVSRPYFSPCHFLFFSRTLSSLLLSFVASRASPSPLLVSDIIPDSLLTLSSFTRFSLPTVLTLPHASSFPFSRFSLHLSRLVSCAPLLHSLSRCSRPTSSRALPEAILHPSLRYRVNPSLLPAPHLSFYFTADGDRTSRRRRRG